jgi:hypothetical protein
MFIFLFILLNDVVIIEIDSIGDWMVNEYGTVAGVRICKGEVHGENLPQCPSHYTTWNGIRVALVGVRFMRTK